MPYYDMMGWYPFMGFWMSLFWIVVLILIAYLIYRLIKGEKSVVPQETISKSTADILDERYAKGELTREQYLQMKEDLKKE
ncbi:MAG: SHOCT domain-containing protein [Methanotrichaceae archaeon]|nr:SHOCT domain-containing protein [Methanotrichaceae archaeon]